MVKNINLVITDIDGVWTDGGMYYSEEGVEIKKFNTRDGMGVERLRNNNIETIICTSENTNIVKNRAKKLKIKNCFLGIKDKGTFLENFFKKEKIDKKTVAYIGDDLNDLEIITKVGFSACPNDAIELIKTKVDYICENMGGKGAFREFAELILEHKK